MDAGNETTAARAVPVPVTVLLPVLDDRPFIRDCLDALLAQDHPVREIVVLDRGSVDGTRDIAARAGPPVTVVDVAGSTVGAALNRGLASVAADIVVWADARSRYPSGHVRRCVEALQRIPADVVGGARRPVGTTTFGRAAAAVASAATAGGRAGLAHASAREVATLRSCAFRRTGVTAAGGFDERGRGSTADEADLHHRVRMGGGEVWFDPSVTSWPLVPGTPRRLWRQRFAEGVEQASSFERHRRLPTRRTLGPAAIVGTGGLALSAGLVRRRPLLVAVPALAYAAGAGVAALRLGRDPAVAPHRALGALAVGHWAQGTGFFVGILDGIRRRRRSDGKGY